ncbi:MAG: response regulator transcription factor [Desulfobacteraceae bacterium]
MQEKILIVDDEQDILELVSYNLKKEGYETLTAMSGEDGLSAAKKFRPDLMVLDLMLPGIDGLEVTRRLRADKETSKMPIVILSAKGEESDIVTGLELGANDYVSKPFSPRELTARIRAIFRRRQKSLENQPTRVTREGDMVIDHDRHLVKINGTSLDLTLSEFSLLSLLAEKKGWVFTRGQIVDAVHGENYAVTERSVDVTVAGLRKKLGRLSSFIETVRGIGYRFREDNDAG